MKPCLLVSALWLGASATLLRRVEVQNNTGLKTAPTTFIDWYNAYASGRGIWKWHNALVAYDTFFGRFTGGPVALIEIGVQSGGSIQMYLDVLGAKSHYYGLDINPKCLAFGSDRATIQILDQGNASQWVSFFVKVPKVDIIIDDGGHQPYQMLTTMYQGFPHVNPGGVFLIEDIHGQNGDYRAGLFHPAADFLSGQLAQVASVHLYPFVLVVQKLGGTYTAPKPADAALTVDTMTALMTALPENRGKVVRLSNPTWATMFSAVALKTFFDSFHELYTGKVTAEPKDCFGDTKQFAQCNLQNTNTPLQSLVIAVDIYPKFVQVHVAAAPPSIYAARKGTEWIPYSGF